MKKIITGVIVLTLIMSMAVFGEDIVNLFDFNTLGETAVENSLSLEAKQLTLDNKILDQEELEVDASNADQVGGDRVTYIKNRTIVESDTLLAAMEVKLAEMIIEKDTAELKDTLYKKGMEYMLLLDEIELNEKLLVNQGVYQSNIEKRVSSGIATNIELTNAAITYQNQEIKIIELKSLRDALKIEINHLLGSDLSADLVIEDTLEKMNYILFDIDKLYNERHEMYQDVYSKTVVLESKTIIFSLNEEKYEADEKEYKTALYNKQIAEIELSDADKSFEVSLRKAYNTYLSNNDAYELAIKQLELQEKLYADATLKYDLGLINEEDLIKAEEAKTNADFAVKKAIYNFNVSRIDLDALY